MHLLDKTCTAYFYDFRADAYIFAAWAVSSNRDFDVEQFFWADEFRADDPSPYRPQEIIIVLKQWFSTLRTHTIRVHN